MYYYVKLSLGFSYHACSAGLFSKNVGLGNSTYYAISTPCVHLQGLLSYKNFRKYVLGQNTDTGLWALTSEYIASCFFLESSL